MPEGGRPLERFVAAANSLGQLLDAEQQEALMQVGAATLGAAQPSCCAGRLGAAQPSRWVLP